MKLPPPLAGRADVANPRQAAYGNVQSFPAEREPPIRAVHCPCLGIFIAGRGVMPDRYLLERVYLRSEARPQSFDRLEAVGQLLRSVIQGPPPNDALSQLCAQLDEVAAAKRR